MDQILEFLTKNKDYFTISRFGICNNCYKIISVLLDSNDFAFMHNGKSTNLATHLYIENNIFQLRYFENDSLPVSINLQELSIPITDEEILCLLAILA